jgi:UDP-glucuronate 4-epimerase
MAMYIFAENISKGKSIPVFNNGNMKRDFTFIKDIISGTKSAIENNYHCEVFNLGNNKSENLMDMIRIIEKSLGKKADIDFQSMHLEMW